MNFLRNLWDYRAVGLIGALVLYLTVLGGSLLMQFCLPR